MSSVNAPLGSSELAVIGQDIKHGYVVSHFASLPLTLFALPHQQHALGAPIGSSPPFFDN